jgi:hypothetical protein
MAKCQHRFIQKKPAEEICRRNLQKKPAEPTAAYRLGGFIGKEGLGKGWGEIFRCGLSIVR